MRTQIFYQFTIGLPLDISEAFLPVSNKTYKPLSIEDRVDKGDPNAYLFNEHDMIFKVKKSNKSKEVNKLEITLFNLDDDVVGYLTTNSGNNLCAILDVGDDDTGLSELFRGTVTSVIDNFNDQDRKTKIQVEDGKVNVQNANTIRTYAAGTPRKTIITEVCQDLQMPLGDISGITGTIRRGTSIYGNTMDTLKNLVKRFDAEVSIQDGYVEILPKTLRQATEVSFLSAESGLVGTVNALVKDTSSTANKSSAESSSVSFECLLDTSIKPNATVYVQDGNYDGAFKINTVISTGSTRQANWLCKVEAAETAGVIKE
jgi:hypothetical protein